jgi:hypothetical protein
MEQINTDMEQQQQGEPKDKRQNIEWRRNMVLEFISQGRTEREIAQILKVVRNQIPIHLTSCKEIHVMKTL